MKIINKFVILVTVTVLAVVIASVAALPVSHNTEQNEVQDALIIQKMSSYTVHQLEDVNAKATTTIQGTIFDKYVIVEARDEFGSLVGDESPRAVVSLPNLVYRLQVSDTYKGDATDSLLVKMAGGTSNNLTVRSDVEEMHIGQQVVLLLDGPTGDGYYQLVAGPNSVFSIQDGKAVGANEEMSLADLRQRLN